MTAYGGILYGNTNGERRAGMNIEISKEYRGSLVPLSENILEPLSVPKETFEFLTEVGLPILFQL